MSISAGLIIRRDFDLDKTFSGTSDMKKSEGFERPSASSFCQ